MRTDTVVIGGGISGLVAAIYVAQAGHSVILVEKNDKPGGRASSTTIKGNVFNMGAHALYRSGQAMHIFRELGIPISGKRLPLGGIAARDGKLHPLPVQAGALLTSSILTRGGKIKFLQLMLGFKKLKAERYRGMSWQDWVSAQFPQDSGAQQLMFALGRLWTYADVPDVLDAERMIRQGQIGMDGVCYLHNGWQSLVDALKERAVSEGVSIMKDNADSLIMDEGKAKGVVLADGERLMATSVIAAVSPDEALRLIERSDTKSGQTLRYWKHYLTPTFASCLDLAVSQLPYPNRSFAMHMERPLYYSNHSIIADLSANGHQVIHLLKYHANAEKIDPKLDRQELEAWMSAIQPCWRKHVVAERFIPKATVSHAVPTVDRPLRPAPDDTGVEGYYISGDWAGDQGMLADAAVFSAKQAARGAIQYLRSFHKGDA